MKIKFKKSDWLILIGGFFTGYGLYSTVTGNKFVRDANKCYKEAHDFLEDAEQQYKDSINKVKEANQKLDQAKTIQALATKDLKEANEFLRATRGY